MHKRSDSALTAELKELGGTDSSALANEEVLQIVLPVLRRDNQAIETYRYNSSPKLTCPILALVGDRDPRVPVDTIRDWGQHTTAELECQIYPGGHFHLVNHHTEFIDAIQKYIPPTPTRATNGSR